ncbi:hypothetical protein ACVXHB_17760 [Escherichia coli]
MEDGCINPGRWRLPGEYMRYRGADASVVASDDGIVARIPDTDGEIARCRDFFPLKPESCYQSLPRGGRQLGTFRRPFRRMRRAGIINAGRTQGHRTPLWQQRLRTSRVAGNRSGISGFSGHSSKPYANVCQDLYNLPALEHLMRRLRRWRNSNIRCNDNYALAFRHKFIVRLCRNYCPERRPAGRAPGSVLSLDSELLRNLLGQVDPGDASTRRSFARWRRVATTGSCRRAKGEEGLFDLLRELGPMTVEDLAQRHTGSSEEVASVSGKSSCSKTNLPSDD